VLALSMLFCSGASSMASDHVYVAKNCNARSAFAPVPQATSRTQSPHRQNACTCEKATTKDPPIHLGTQIFTSNGLFAFSSPRARAASAIVDVSWIAPGSSTNAARRSRAISSAGEISGLMSLYAAAERIIQARLCAEEQSIRFKIQVRESRTIGRLWWNRNAASAIAVASM